MEDLPSGDNLRRTWKKIASYCGLSNEPASFSLISRHKRIEKMFQRLQLLRALEDNLQNGQQTFGTVKQLYQRLRENYDIGEFSICMLYRVIREKGFRYKRIVVRQNENDQTKEGRIVFLQKYVRFLNENSTKVIYFDWTSFSSDNFKKRMWSQKGAKSVTKKVRCIIICICSSLWLQTRSILISSSEEHCTANLFLSFYLTTYQL